jgi:hypothetical protein
MDIDPQEDRDVTWRLGSSSYKEDGSDSMYSMSSTPGENESIPSNFQSKVEDSAGEYVVWIIRFAIISYMFGIATRLWSDEETRLRLMHLSIRMFQNIARLFGGWALEAEKSYNQYVESLH